MRIDWEKMDMIRINNAVLVSGWFKIAAREGQGGVCQHAMNRVGENIKPTEEDILRSARTVDFSGNITVLEDLVSCCADKKLAKRILDARLQNFKRIGWKEKEVETRKLIGKLSIHVV
jgi:hypothetical protein